MKFLGNAVMFVILYFLFMVPTYLLPYMGSNSAVLNAAGTAAGAGLSPLFWYHLGSLVVLCVVAWLRGALIEKSWLIIFPILAALFDLMPGLSYVPHVPTVMHIFVIILGVIGKKAAPQAMQQMA